LSCAKISFLKINRKKVAKITPWGDKDKWVDAANNCSDATAEVASTTNAAGTSNSPTFSPVAGIYGAAQNVAISTTTSPATICYTTDGVTAPTCNASAACTTGTQYPGSAVAVATTTTLKAIACKSTFTDSIVTTGTFTIDTVAPMPGNSGTVAGSN